MVKIIKTAALSVAVTVLAGCSLNETANSGGGNSGSGVLTERYSREVIEAHLHGWYNKDVLVAFPEPDSAEPVAAPAVEASWDYVPGVVAKGILDTWEYYQDSVWADAWYKSLCYWGLRQQATDRGGILDDLNCTKVFISLYEGAKPGGKFENAENAAYFMEQMRRGAKGLAEHKALYSINIQGDNVQSTKDGVAGGWMHKATGDPAKSYWGQMWCDGAYMGPALLAQLIAAGATEGFDLGWDDVVRQFTASWPYLWDEEKKLLYHVLFTDVTENRNGKAIYDAGHLYECIKGQSTMYKGPSDQVPCAIYRSEEFWGRADGWYILALVDVLEAYMKGATGNGQWTRDQVPSTVSHSAEFKILHGYLKELAEGLVARQDPMTGCWYQLLQYGPEKCATQGVDDTGSPQYTNVAEGGTQCNYLESSASCLITAALLKGTRLGLLDYAEAGKRGFEGIVKHFLTAGYDITSSCQSAGLSKDRNGTAAYYLIGKDVPIQDNTEGKVLGAFLMAAVEYERAYPPKAATREK